MYYDNKGKDDIPEFEINQAGAAPPDGTEAAPQHAQDAHAVSHRDGATYHSYSRLTPDSYTAAGQHENNSYRGASPVSGGHYHQGNAHDGVNPTYYTPPYGPPPSAPQGARRRWSTGKTFAVAAIILALIMFSASFINFFTNYELRLTQGDRGLSASFVPKNGDEKDGVSPVPREDLTPDSSAQTNVTAGTQQPPSAPIGDGTTLAVSGTPEHSTRLTMQEIYKKCVPSIVSVTANYDYGEGGGTGIIMSADGYIITNTHVIEDCMSITVTTADGADYDAAVVGSDASTDLCVLKIDARGLTPAEFGDSAILEVGDEAYAIGNPLGQTLTMTNGIISGIDRTVQISGYTMTLLQTSAPINSGNSGGPLINIYGQVIGVTNAKLTSYYTTVEGIGFAIPVATTKPIVDELIANGKIVRPVVGITVITVDATLSAYYDMPVGVVINSVTPGTDADSKGLLEGDLILAINGIDVATSDELRAVIAEYGVGDTVVLEIERKGDLGSERFTVEIVLVDGSDYD